MKPFNLEDALSGAPVTTTSGKPVSDIKHFPSKKDGFRVVGIINDQYEAFTEDGKFLSGGPHPNDLVMAPKKTFINIYPEMLLNCHRFLSREDADAKACNSRVACLELPE